MRLLAIFFVVGFFVCLSQNSFAEELAQPTYHKGKVLYTVDSVGYSYIKYEENGNEFWAALPQADIKVGDIIILSSTPPLINFQSVALKMTFDKISFIPGVKITFRDKKYFNTPEEERAFYANQPDPGTPRIQSSAKEAETSVSRLHSDISKLAPNWMTTNDDPKFIAWAQSTREPKSGTTIIVLLNEAYKRGDADSVAAIFIDYNLKNHGLYPTSADWKYYGGTEIKSKGVLFSFYDASSLKKSDKLIKAWIKSVYFHDIEKLVSDEYKRQYITDRAAAKVANGYLTPYSKVHAVVSNLDFTTLEETANLDSLRVEHKILYEIACVNRKIKQLSLTAFRDREVTTMSESELGGWIYITPDSNAETLAKILCP